MAYGQNYCLPNLPICVPTGLYTGGELENGGGGEGSEVVPLEISPFYGPHYELQNGTN